MMHAHPDKILSKCRNVQTSQINVIKYIKIHREFRTKGTCDMPSYAYKMNDG